MTRQPKTVDDVGSLAFWLQHKDADWVTNSHGYTFSGLEIHGIKIRVTKHPDRNLELDLDTPFGGYHNIRVAIPCCDERGLFVVITWQRPEIKVYLNNVMSHAISF
ncbi:MAG: hypothetical protein HY695_30780 [Deltaproteobacteria bacterium]|nr:hypothetical protein [Deltaproteobacteria bacterium]